MVDLTKESPESVVSKVDPNDGTYTTNLLHDLETGRKEHAIWAYDAQAAALRNRHLVANLNASCGASGTTDVGAAGIPLIKAQLAYVLGTVKATHITWQDLKVDGVPGVEVSSQFTTPGYETTYGWELAVLPKPHQACEVTVSGGNGASLGSILSVAAATAPVLVRR